MLRYTLLRLLSAIPTLLLVVMLAFALVHLAPGGPFDTERAFPPETRQALEQKYRLDEPLHIQFWHYLSNAVRGDLGPSYYHSEYSVNQLIGKTFPLSLQLGVAAFALATVVGIGSGIFSALQRDTLSDRMIMGFSMTGISIPVFVIAPALILLFAVGLQWLPAGWSSGSGAARWFVPVISLALPLLAAIARLTRANLIDVLGQDFIRTARAQGLSRMAVVRHHALKPALLPVLSYMGPAMAGVLTGSVVVERIYSVPGLGQQFVSAAMNRDYTLVLGVVIFYGVLIVLFNLIVDILYGVVDPRVRYR